MIAKLILRASKKVNDRHSVATRAGTKLKANIKARALERHARRAARNGTTAFSRIDDYGMSILGDRADLAGKSTDVGLDPKTDMGPIDQGGAVVEITDNKCERKASLTKRCRVICTEPHRSPG